MSLWTVFGTLQHLMLMLKDARAQLQRGNTSSLCDCPYERNSWKVNLCRKVVLQYLLLSCPILWRTHASNFNSKNFSRALLIFFCFCFVIFSLLLYTPTFFSLCDWIWKSRTHQLNVNGKIWRHGFTNCAVNSNKFFTFIATAYEKKQGNELQPNSEWELDITPTPTDVIW